MLGLRSSCERVEFMFALVMALTPVSIWGGTWSTFGRGERNLHSVITDRMCP